MDPPMSVASPHKSFNLMPHMDTWKACWDMSHSVCDIFCNNSSQACSDLLFFTIISYSRYLEIKTSVNAALQKNFLLHLYVLFSCTKIKSFLNQYTFTWEAKRLKMLCLKPSSKISEVMFKKTVNGVRKIYLIQRDTTKLLFSHNWYIFSCFRHKLT